jgi:nickel-type superoxide dismutase maturation protease
MLPKYKQNQKILVFTFSYFFSSVTVGNVIVLHHPVTNQKIIKRITDLQHSKAYVLGDNKSESSDSRSFGWIDKKNIIGKVIYPV